MKNLSFIENEAFQEWNRLIRDFKNAESQLKRVTLEKQTLIQRYIKPFFRLLGWTTNKKSTLHLEKIEPIENPGKPAAPSYLLVNKHKPLFFIDIKKPAFPIKEQKERAFQLRRYSFSANLPIAVSTDFEEFALFDCRIKPDINDDLEKARLFYCDIDTLFSPCEIVPGVRNIDFLFSVFSSSALTGTHFRQFLEEMPAPTYMTNVNHELSKATESWHFTLFRELYALNPGVSKQDLSHFTSHFVLTLLYWRYLEDTKREKYATLYQISLSDDPWRTLKTLWENNKHIWKKEFNLFHHIDIGRETLYSILQQLYYPASPFEFSVIPPSTYLRTYISIFSKKKQATVKSNMAETIEPKHGKTMFSSIVEHLLQFRLLTVNRKKVNPWIPVWNLDSIWANLLSAFLSMTNTKWKLDYAFCPMLSPDLVWIQDWFPPVQQSSGQPQKEGFLYIPYEDAQQNKEIVECIIHHFENTLQKLQRIALLFDIRWTNHPLFQHVWNRWTETIFPKSMHFYQMNKQAYILVFLAPESKPKQILFTKYTLNDHCKITQTILQPISLDFVWKTTASI